MVTVEALVILNGMLCLVFGQITLPFQDNMVAGVTFDDQPLDLYMDSATRGTYIIYKEWYEETYGECPPETCYVCIPNCDPYREEKLIVRFTDGSKITTVCHRGVAGLGGYKLEMEFRLLIGWSPGPGLETEKPMNYFGLAYDVHVYRSNILVQLFLKKIISEMRVSICTFTDPKTMCGKVVLGSFTEEQCLTVPHKTVIPMKSPEFCFNTALFSLGLVSSRGKPFMEEVSDGIVIYDTGAYCIVLPKALFEFVLEKIKNTIKQDSKQSVSIETRNGEWYIERKGYNYLPKLAFDIGGPTTRTTVLIPPRHYTEACDDTWCALLLQQYDLPKIILGRPFFTVYFSSFSEKVSGERTVTLAQYASTRL